MTPTDPNSLPDSPDSRQKLLSAGYKQKACKLCDGVGSYWLNGVRRVVDCIRCSGRGWVWEAPIGG